MTCPQMLVKISQNKSHFQLRIGICPAMFLCFQHAPQVVKKYLGLALLPTAGVTVGLVLEAKGIFGPSQISEVMVNAVLGSVIINELLTPFFVRFSLIKAGEAIQT